MSRNFLKNLFERFRIFEYMGVIKTKRDDCDTSRFVEDYLSTWEKYRFLKNAELSDIPDKKLLNAVNSWISNIIKNEYKVLSSLPKPCQNVYCCNTVIAEVFNGGFNQLFFNRMVQLAEMSIEGFLALGVPELSNVMAKAIELYQQNKPVLDSYNDGTLESFSASYQERIFDDLDNEFFDGCDYLGYDDAKYVQYIRQNAECFGD